MSEFHFLRPWWLLAFFPLIAACWQVRRLGQAGEFWQRLCDPALLPHILSFEGGKTRQARLPVWLIALGGSLAILALAGPVWERLPTPAFRNDAALVIALDLSRTMDAADIKPSRLERARFRIADLLDQRKDGLTALLVYSGEAFVVTPLTDDGETIRSQLTALTTQLMPVQGSRADLALELAQRLLKQSGLTRGDVLLLTSGVNLSTASPAAGQLKGQGYRLSVLGVGAEEGAPVPLPEGGFLQDTKGGIVISQLASPALRQLASEGGGIYRTLAADGSDLPPLLAFFQEHREAQNSEGSASVNIEQWLERGPWLLLAIVPIAALAFRRGYLGLALFFLILPAPRPAQALEWRDLWQTRDQQAQQAFLQGQTQQAAERFENPDWRAAAQYKSGQYKEAAASLSPKDTAEANYNRGNALAKQAKYEDAIRAYDKALAEDPKHEDAQHNKALVEQALKEQQEQQQKQDQGQGQDKQEGEKGENQKQDKGQQQDSGQKDSKKPPPPETPQGEKNDGQGEKDQKSQKDQGETPAEHSEQDRRETGKDQEDAEHKSEPATASDAQGAERKGEDQQASEQWLRRIPDDPGGLLKRKFYYQYQQRQGQRPGAQR